MAYLKSSRVRERENEKVWIAAASRHATFHMSLIPGFASRVYPPRPPLHDTHPQAKQAPGGRASQNLELEPEPKPGKLDLESSP